MRAALRGAAASAIGFAVATAAAGPTPAPLPYAPILPIPARAESEITSATLPNGRLELSGTAGGPVDQGPGVMALVAAPRNPAEEDALAVPVQSAAGAMLVELLATPEARAHERNPPTWTAGALLAGEGRGAGFLLPRCAFAPRPHTDADGPLPATTLTLSIRQADRMGRPFHLVAGPTPAAWTNMGRWPENARPEALQIAVVDPSENRPTTPTLVPGRVNSAALWVTDGGGRPMARGRLMIEGPDRDSLLHPDAIEVRDGRATLELWPRRPGAWTLHFLEPDRRLATALDLSTAENPAVPMVRVSPEGFLGRAILGTGGLAPLALETTVPAGMEPIRSIHVLLRDMAGRPLFSRWISAERFASGAARLAVPAMGWLSLDSAATTMPLHQVSHLDADYPAAPDAIPRDPDSMASPPFSMSRADWPDGVTTASYAGMVLTLEEVGSTVPIVARDRMAVVGQHRSPAENQFYSFPLGIEGAGQLNDRSLDRARSLGALQRRIGTFWAAEELDFASTVAGPGSRLWSVTERVWPIRRSEYSRVALILSGLAAWTDGWPMADDGALTEWGNWLGDLKRRYPQISLWMIGRDLDRPRKNSLGEWLAPATPAQAARLVEAAAKGLRDTGLPFRVGLGATDGFRPAFLAGLLASIDRSTTGMQTLAIRLRPTAPNLLPDANGFDLIGNQQRDLVNSNALGASEAWWLPVELASHPAALDPMAQADALCQTMALATANRISKVFLSRIADSADFHPANPALRTGLLDCRLRPKPALAAFLVNTFMLTLTERVDTGTTTAVALTPDQGAAEVAYANYSIRVHSRKQPGRLTIAWARTPEGKPGTDWVPPSAAEQPVPPPAWPLPAPAPPIARFAYRSEMGGPVYAFSSLGTLVEPLSVRPLSTGLLGPTGVYEFPVGRGPLYIWDSGIRWGLGEPAPE